MKKSSLFQNLKQNQSPNYNIQFEKILKTSALIFSREGFEKTSIRTIAKESSLSLATLYYYIKNKEELLFQIQYNTFELLVNTATTRLSSLQKAQEKLEVFILTHVEIFFENIYALKVCARDLETLQGDFYQEVLKLRKKYFRIAYEIIEELLLQFKSPLDPWLTTANMFGMMNWFYQWYDPKKKNFSPEKMAEEQFSLFLNGIHGA